jgi:galactokinase
MANVAPARSISTAVLQSRFRDRFGVLPRIFRAPARVNLIGEHTDYSEGYVLPAAIDLFCSVAIAPRPDANFGVYSEQLNACETTSLHELRPRHSWSDYPFGVCWSLQQSNLPVPASDLYVSSEVPLGAGLSSSAALEVSIGYALLSIAERMTDRTRLALICQRAENDFVGARCGIMDQFIACHGRARHAILLDCRSLLHQELPLPADLQLVICNTMVKHELAGGEYNARRADCEQAVHCLASELPGIRTLRDVNLDELERHAGKLSPTLYRRARHVITENVRTLEFASALNNGRIQDLRHLMAASHRSLKEDFEVSCKELDLLVEIASRQPGLLGARMTGGGFGGCTINLVSCQHAETFASSVASEYRAATGLMPDVYTCSSSEGAREIMD